ncbi:MAG: hypothetical protein ACPH5I_02925 [Amylibacter sp.]
MEFKKKISNVSFGGNWSEELITEYEIVESLTSLQWAVDNCRKQEVNTAEVNTVLIHLTKDLEKGKILSDRFKRGHLIIDQNLREAHFRECFRLIKVWLKI